MPDVQITNHYSIFTFLPLTDEAREWIDENVAYEDWQWSGGALAVEPRYAAELASGMQNDGLEVE